MMFIAYNMFIFPFNIKVISGAFSVYAIERLMNLLMGRISHAVFFALSGSSIYPLRVIIYRYELHGGYAVALFEAIASTIIYIWLLLKGNSSCNDVYISIAICINTLSVRYLYFNVCLSFSTLLIALTLTIIYAPSGYVI